MRTATTLRRTLRCLPLLFAPLLGIAAEGCGSSNTGSPDVVQTDATQDTRTDSATSGDARADGTTTGGDARSEGGTTGNDGSTVTADGCVPAPENSDTACSDGIDNDCDGHIDCTDFDCLRNSSVTVCTTDGGGGGGDGAACTPTGAENTDTACGDGLDNDCDGYVDCNDFDCSRSTTVTVCGDGGTSIDAGACTPTGAENTNAACGDGIDNDCDGHIDCNDFDCSRSTTVTVCARDGGGTRRDVGSCTPTGMENTNSACGDGVDNDCDGYVDCNDFDCSRTSAVTVCATDGGNRRDVGSCTPTGMENTDTACGDGVDNDCDGYVDCNDFDCSRSTTVTVCATDGGGRG